MGLELPTYAIVVAVVRHGDQYLVAKRAAAKRFAPGQWEFISGFLDQEGTAGEIILKELREEAGLGGNVVRSADPFAIVDDEARWAVTPYLIEASDSNFRLNPSDHSEMRWVRREELDSFSDLAPFLSAAQFRSFLADQPNRKTVVAVSGGFDPVHVGHARLFQEARKLGDRLVVILNNDNWLRKKKGVVFMPQEERQELIAAFKSVDEVVLTGHPENPTDMSVCAELEVIKPSIFANGGDRTKNNIPEVATCEQIGCQMVFNVGTGGKVQSSSWLLSKYLERQGVDTSARQGKL